RVLAQVSLVLTSEGHFLRCPQRGAGRTPQGGPERCQDGTERACAGAGPPSTGGTPLRGGGCERGDPIEPSYTGLELRCGQPLSSPIASSSMLGGLCTKRAS